MGEGKPTVENVDSISADGKTANVAMKEPASDDEQIGNRIREKGIAYGMPYNNTYNMDLYPNKVTWQEGDLTATRTTMWSGPGCHSGCQIIFYTDKDGKLVKTEGDPNSPLSAGRLCMRCLELPQMVNSERRLKWPVKRVGERGEGKWQRISWDEAYDMIIENVRRIQKDYGPECIVSMIGTGRNVSQAIAHNQYANFGGADLTLCFLSGDSCMLPRTALCYVIMGNQWVADFSQFRARRFEDDPEYTIPEVALIWGTNPVVCNSDAFLGHWIVEAMKRGTKLVTIDPQLTWIAAHSEMWLRLRPGTDAALALGMMNVIISEELYDRDCIRVWFDPLRTLTKASSKPFYEAKSDEQIMIELGHRIAPEKWPEHVQTDRDYMDWRLTRDGVLDDDGTQMTMQRVEEKYAGMWYHKFRYRKYEIGALRPDGQPGFMTPTGRYELYCTLFAAFGDDPLPYYQEPPTSPVSTPELAEKYPYIITTGKRSFEFFHSEWRQPETISRQLHPDPMFDIHPDTAAKHGIIDGDWVWIENQMGKMKQRARLNPSLDPRVISTEHGWWFPEREPAEPSLFGVFDSNPNNLIPQCENGTNGYGAPIKCAMGTIYKVTPENDTLEDQPSYQVCTTGYTHGKTHASEKPSFYDGWTPDYEPEGFFDIEEYWKTHERK